MSTPTSPKENRRKKNQQHKKKHGKQATDATNGTNRNKYKRTSDGDRKLNQSNENNNTTNSSTDGNNDSNNSKDKENKREMTNKSSKFNDDQCPGKLGGHDDTTNVKQRQNFNINVNFGNVSQKNVPLLLLQFVEEITKKNNGIEFHTTNTPTTPTPTVIISKEQYPMKNAGFNEFFTTRYTPTNLTLYYSVILSITITELRH